MAGAEGEPMHTLEQVKKTVTEAAKEAKETVVDAAKEAAEKVVEAAEMVAEKVKSKVAPQDALSLLKQDHQTISSYFEKIAAAKGSPQKQEELYAQLKYELDAHSAAEEQEFYPALKKLDGASALVSEAQAAHALFVKLFGELSALPVDDKEWLNKITALKENVQQHFAQEEGPMFKLAQTAWSEKQLQEMGTRLEQAKQAFEAKEKTTKGQRPILH
jgi:hemerythrin superfamily protein